MTMTPTPLAVSPLCLGTNIFGWTADERESFAVLDAYVAAGHNFLDTADVYSAWVDGHSGGESEAVIGAWLRRRGNRDRVLVATKVGNLGGLAADNVRRCLEDSLLRLHTDYVDIYYLHRDVADVPLQETLGAVDDEVRRGRVRHVGLSNFSAARATEAIEICARDGLSPIRMLSPHYNLLERKYENRLAAVCAAHGIACVPYYALASGFLTGKYRPGVDVGSARGRLDGSRYLDDRGIAALAVLEAIALEHDTTLAAVALAWLRSRPTVVAPIASARTPEQLAQLLPMDAIELSDAELDRLSAV
jgi:aryl-alcohol dehydrogenase-like predicted oxidoreductase